MSQETKPQTCLTSDFENINVSERDVKGYNFEVLTSKLLDRYGIEYNSNPLGSIIEWKKHQGRGVDFKIPELNIELEAKSGYARIYRSWILRDWITRFSYHNEIRIVIVKPTLKLSDKCLELLFNYGINVIYPDSISYLISRANKLIEAKSNEKEATNSKNEAKNSKSELANNIRHNPVPSEGTGLETKEISFPGKEISPTLGEFSLSKRLKNVCMNLLLQIKRLALKLWYDRSGNIGVKRIDLKEILKREGEGVYMNGIRLYPLVSNPVFPCDYYSIGVVPYYDTKHCKHKGVIVCKLKHYKPFYVCRLLLLEKLQKFYQLKDNVFLCSKTVCKDSSSECPYRTIVCKHILKDKACPMIPKCYSKPLPKPKVLPSPDLTYYLNLSTSGDE